MRMMITGGSGFLGSHIADAASAAGHQVVVFDLKPSPWLRPDQTMVIGSILDPATVEAAMAGCQAVYHLAALADINEAVHRPQDTVEINIIGTLNLLEAACRHGLERFIFSSSIYVYSNHGSFYRTTKQACEHLIHDYHEQFGLNYTVLRFGSLYGLRADASNGVYRLLRQALDQRRIDYIGTGDEVREYIHVLDAAGMSVDILDPEFANQFIHLTGHERMTSRDMLYMIREIMGGDIDIKLQGVGQAHHYQQTPYSYTPKLGQRLTRRPPIDLEAGLLDCLHQLGQTWPPLDKGALPPYPHQDHDGPGPA